MTSARRRRTACARRTLAVVQSLRAAADAARVAIVDAYPDTGSNTADAEAAIAAQLSDLLQRLDRVVLAYCDHVADLPQLRLFPPPDDA